MSDIQNKKLKRDQKQENIMDEFEELACTLFDLLGTSNIDVVCTNVGLYSISIIKRYS